MKQKLVNIYKCHLCPTLLRRRKSNLGLSHSAGRRYRLGYPTPISPSIVSLCFSTLGSTDVMLCVHCQEQTDSENRVYTEYIKVPLDSGSLLIMEGAVQNDWQVTVTDS